MKYLLLGLSFLLPAAFIQAQDVPKGPTKLDVSITTSTNATLIPVDLTTEEDRSKSSLSVDSDGEKLDAVESSFTVMKEVPLDPSSETSESGTLSDAEGTNDVLNAKTAFLMEMAEKYTSEGDFAEAEQAYLRALKKDPDNPSLRFSLSALYLQTARYEEAAVLLTRMKDEFPYNPIIYNNLAWIYATSETMKNSTKALLYAREAILSKPADPSLWDTLATAYYISGDYEKALRSANHTLDLLRQIRASKEQLQPYINRQTKIQRASEAFKQLTGVADKKE